MDKSNLADIAQGLDKLNENLDEIRINSAKHTVILNHHSEILERNTDSLDEHIRRTDLLEKQLITIAVERQTSLKMLKYAAGFIGFLGLSSILAFVKTLLGI